MFKLSSVFLIAAVVAAAAGFCAVAGGAVGGGAFAAVQILPFVFLAVAAGLFIARTRNIPFMAAGW